MNWKELIERIHKDWPFVDGRKYPVPSYVKPLKAAIDEYGIDMVAEGLDKYLEWLGLSSDRKPMSPPRFFSEGHFLSEYQIDENAAALKRLEAMQ